MLKCAPELRRIQTPIASLSYSKCQSIGKDAYKNGEDLDIILDWACTGRNHRRRSSPPRWCMSRVKLRTGVS